MKKLNLIIALILVSIWCKAQQPMFWECGVNSLIQPSSNPNNTLPSCTDFLSYIPDANTQTLVYKLNFHYMRMSNGTGVFQPADLPLINAVMQGLNQTYASFALPTLSVGAPFIQNPKIQFELAGVYYHDDDALYYFNPFGIYQADQSFMYNTIGVNKETELNIFWYYDPNYAVGVGIYPNYINMIFNNYANYTSVFGGAAINVVGHELGHALAALTHTFGYTGCTTQCNCGDDGLSDTYYPDCNTGWLPCSTSNISPTCCSAGAPVSNNIMGYNTCRNYLSPMQLGWWHYFANTLGTTKKLTACDYDVANSRYVTNDETWTRTYVIGGDLFVQNNSTLTVNCNVFMPGEGRVIVEAGSTLIIDGGTFTNACSEMWEGIQILDGASIQVINTSKIEEAYYGITLFSGSTFHIEKSDFLNNYIGILIPKDPSGFTFVTGDISGCTFDFSGSFNPYNGTNSPPLTKPFAGIIATTTFVNIGVAGMNANLFNNMNCGIYSANSFTRIVNSKFTNISNYDSYDWFSGTGVVSEGGAWNCNLSFAGLGAGAGDPAAFDNCDIAIQTTRSACDISNSKIQNVPDAIVCTNALKFDRINIHDNSITSQHQGISLIFNELATNVNVYLNSIEVGQVYNAATILSTGGIYVSEYFSGANNNLHIAENNIGVTFGNFGIESLNSNRALIYYNDIKYHHWITPSPIGIGLFHNFNSSVKCNSVSDPSNTVNWINHLDAYVFTMNTGTQILCNSALDAELDFKFLDNNFGTVFRGNNLTNFFTGLYLSNNAIIDPQFEAGTNWANPANLIIINHAKNANTSYLSQSRFDVNPTDGTPFNPTLVSPSVGWFFNDYSAHHYLCAEHVDVCPSIDFVQNGGNLSDMDLRIADDSIAYEEFDPETRERAKMYLVSKINANSNLLSNQVIQNFYNNILTTNLNDIDDVRTATFDLLVTDELINAQLAYNDSIIDTIRKTIDVNTETINTSTNQTTISTLQAINAALLLDLSQLALDNEQLLDYENQLRDGEADAALILNAAYIPGSIQQENEQIVNSIYLATVGRNIYQFTTSQYNDLFAIASQCPMAGGRAVYMARAMLSLVDRNFSYDDETTCTALGLFRKGQVATQPKTAEKLQSVILQPNPVNDVLHCIYSMSEDNLSLEIRSVEGQQVYSSKLKNFSGSLTITTSKWSQGMYFLYFKSADKIVKAEKVLIAH